MSSFALQQRMTGTLETTVDVVHDARSLLKGIETVYVNSMSHEEDAKKREHEQRQQEEATQYMQKEMDTLRARLLEEERRHHSDTTIKEELLNNKVIMQGISDQQRDLQGARKQFSKVLEALYQRSEQHRDFIERSKHHIAELKERQGERKELKRKNKALQSELDASSKAAKLVADDLQRAASERDELGRRAEELQGKLEVEVQELRRQRDTATSSASAATHRCHVVHSTLTLELKEVEGRAQQLRKQLQETQLKFDGALDVASREATSLRTSLSHEQEEKRQLQRELSEQTAALQGHQRQLQSEREQRLEEQEAHSQKASSLESSLADEQKRRECEALEAQQQTGVLEKELQSVRAEGAELKQKAHELDVATESNQKLLSELDTSRAAAKQAAEEMHKAASERDELSRRADALQTTLEEEKKTWQQEQQESLSSYMSTVSKLRNDLDSSKAETSQALAGKADLEKQFDDDGRVREQLAEAIQSSETHQRNLRCAEESLSQEKAGHVKTQGALEAALKRSCEAEESLGQARQRLDEAEQWKQKQQEHEEVLRRDYESREAALRAEVVALQAKLASESQPRAQAAAETQDQPVMERATYPQMARALPPCNPAGMHINRRRAAHSGSKRQLCAAAPTSAPEGQKSAAEMADDAPAPDPMDADEAKEPKPARTAEEVKEPKPARKSADEVALKEPKPARKAEDAKVPKEPARKAEEVKAPNPVRKVSETALVRSKSFPKQPANESRSSISRPNVLKKPQPPRKKDIFDFE